MSKYNLIILFGKSGAGKDYILKKVYYANRYILNPIILDTTRPPRLLEINGINYNFKTEEEYHKTSHLGEVVFNNWYYGIPLTSLKEGKINIGILSPKAIEKLYEEQEDINIKLFYISASDKKRLYRQLEREEYPDVSEICRRFLADEEDFKNLYKMPFKELRNGFDFDIAYCIRSIEKTIEELQNDLDNIS